MGARGRRSEKRLIREWNLRSGCGKEAFSIEIIEGDYERELYFERIKGLKPAEREESAALPVFCSDLKEQRHLEKKRVGLFHNNADHQPFEKCTEDQWDRGAACKGIWDFLPSDFKKKTDTSGQYSSEEWLTVQVSVGGRIFSRMEREEKSVLVKSVKNANIKTVWTGGSWNADGRKYGLR